jgi:hypothetical protein
VRVAGAIFLLVTLCGCGPSDEQLAQQCGVSVTDLKRTKSAVNAMQPYAGAELGKCSVFKDDSGIEVASPEEKRRTDLMVKNERQAILNGIADKCGLARSTFKIIGDGNLRVQPSPDAHYESVDCALTELRKNKLVSDLPTGFVGNEYVPENRQ